MSTRALPGTSLLDALLTSRAVSLSRGDKRYIFTFKSGFIAGLPKVDLGKAVRPSLTAFFILKLSNDEISYPTIK